MISYLGNKSVSFLGLPINAFLSTDGIKEQLEQKLEKFLAVTNRSSLSHQQKLRVYKDSICQCLSLLLSLSDLPLSWVECMLEPQMTRMLKKWCGLSRSADPSHIYLSKANGGLNITSCYKKAQVQRYSQLMQSRDSACHFLAERQHTREKQTNKQFKPTAEVITVMPEHPGATRNMLASEARKHVDRCEEEKHISHASVLTKERDPCLEREGRRPVELNSGKPA